MNLPNKLTIVRVCLIPFFVAALLFDHGNNYTMRIVANVLFIIASLTDLFDGKIARKYNLVTNFGKFMDPLADKLLVTSALICFVGQGMIPAVVAIIILSREFLVTSIRLVAAPKGRVIPADKWGKSKTICQMIWISTLLLIQWALSQGIQGDWMVLLNQLLMSLTTVLTVFSGGNYLIKNIDLLKG